VIQCKQCGAELPEHAKFCLQCGARMEEPEPETPAPQGFEQQPPPPARQPAPMPDLDFVQPALTGGMFLGLLSSLPIIQAGNCLCCMWVLLGGAIATVMLTRQRPLNQITYGDGAFAGVLSGAFGAVIGTLVQMAFRAMTSRLVESQQQQLEDYMNKLNLPDPWRDWLLRVASGEVSRFTLLFTLLSNLLVYALFAMIGGILAIAILNRREAAKSTRGT
jgi:zinc-ribbon domain